MNDTQTPGSGHPSDGRIALALFVAISLIYIALSRGVFLYGDDILMFQVTEGIVERGTFAVSSPHDEGDIARSIPGEDGRGYAKYGIGQSLVAVPMYVVSDLLLEPLLRLEVVRDAYGNQRLGPLVYGTALTNALLGGANVALTWLLARALDDSRRTAFVVALLLAFATPLTHYAATFLSEPLTMLALLVTVYGLVRAASARPESLSKVSDTNEDTTPPPVILSRSEGSPGTVNRSALVGGRALRFPSTLVSSSPGDPSLRLRMTGGGVVSSSTVSASDSIRSLSLPNSALSWLALSGFAAGLALAARIATGVTLIAPGLWFLWLAWQWGRSSSRDGLLACLAWGMPAALWLAGIGMYNRIRFGSVWQSGYGGEASEFTEQLLTGMTGLLVSPGKGVLWYSPPLLLALAGSWRFARRRPDLALVIAGMFAATLALYSRYYVWDGGGVWGSRFLLPLVPLLLLPAADVIERLWQARPRRRLVASAVVVIAALGLWISAVSIVVPFDRYVNEYNATEAQKHDAIWKIAASPIVVHTERANDFATGPDIAPVRYNAMRLALISVVTGVAGVVMLGWTWRNTFR